MSPYMDWREWVDLKIWKVLSHHVTAVGGAILCLKIVYWLVGWGFEPGLAKTIIEEVDTWMTVGLLLVFAVRLAKIARTWLTEDGENHGALMVA